MKNRSISNGKLHMTAIGICLVLLLSGCTGNDEPTDSKAVDSNGEAGSAPDATQPATRDMPSKGTFIARESDVAAGDTFEFEIDGEKAILINFNGQYRAYMNTCDHKGGPNKLDGEEIVCQWHGSRFDPLSGGLKKGPASSPLKTIDLDIVDGSIYAR